MTNPTQSSTHDARANLTARDLAAGAALLKAVADANFSGIEMAKRAGADPGALYPDPDDNGASMVSAVWQGIRKGSTDYLLHVIGSDQVTVPMAYENEKDGAVDLFDALAKLYARDSEQYRLVSPQVERCFDFSSPQVAYRAWDLAGKIMTPKSPATLPHITDFVYGERLLGRGARPENKAAGWEHLLGKRVALYAGAEDPSGEKVVPMTSCLMTSLNCARYVRQMLEDGIDPNMRVFDLPLLHHTGPSRVPEISQRLIEAGADVHATCTPEQFRTAFASRLEAIGADALNNIHRDLTAADVARILGNNELLQVLEAQRARSAVDAVLRAAAARKEA